MHDALRGLLVPLLPQALLYSENVLHYHSLQLSQWLLFLFEWYFFGDILLAVVGLESKVSKVESEGWGEGHIELVIKKGVLDEGWLILAHEHLNYASYYFPDLVVDEALPLDGEFEPLLIYLLAPELHDESSSLGVFGLQVLAVVVKIVCAFEFAAALIDLTQDIYLILCIVFFYEVVGRAYVAVSPRFNHLPEIEPAGHPSEAVHNNLGAFENLLQFYQQLSSLHGLRLVVVLLWDRE